MQVWFVLLVGLTAIAAIVALVWRPMRTAVREAQFARARREFHRQRERLEAKVFDLASSSGKPRGLRWLDTDFEDAVAYARNRRNGDLAAFVGVTVSFEAVEGGLMEDVEAVSDLRVGTAVFRYQRGAWQTDGRILFNLNPTDAIAYYHDHFEMVGQELAHRH